MRLLRLARVGLPSPVQTKASSATRLTRSGWRSANSAARNAPDEAPYISSFASPLVLVMYSLTAARSSAPLEMSQLTSRVLVERP